MPVRNAGNLAFAKSLLAVVMLTNQAIIVKSQAAEVFIVIQSTPGARHNFRHKYFLLACIWLSLNEIKRRERDSNPRSGDRKAVFKTAAFNHSAIPPDRGTIVLAAERPGK